MFRRRPRFPERIDRWDASVMQRIAKLDTPALFDFGLARAASAADRSVLWFGLSALMAASGRKPWLRAAARGTASIAVTSLVTNQVGKRVLVRDRPALTVTPVARLAFRRPKSNSFPSGHSASAAAFALSVATEAPGLAVPIGGLAAAVAFSRVYTGVHFPSDVLAGVAIGAGIAGAGAVLVKPGGPQLHRPCLEEQRPQPPRPTGKGVVAVVNPKSGPGASNGVAGQLGKALPDAEVVELDDQDDLPAVFASVAQRAEVLAVAGGDGTIRCAAKTAMQHDLPLLVVPAGTFNHFARDLELDSVDDAVEALAAGRAIAVDVGEADGQPFLNTASVGSYPEFVAIRERWEARIGKPLAAAVAMFTVVRRYPPIEVGIDGVPHHLLMFFVGNGTYVPRGFVPRGRLRLDSGKLDIRLLDARRGGSLRRAFIAALSADLRGTRGYVERHEDALTVRLLGAPCRLARDGEVDDASDEVRFSVRRAALTVYRGAPCTTRG